jgi:hypothetical protein
VSREAAAPGRCGACVHFQSDGQSAERALPGLAALSSGHGASRADDGLCVRYDRLLRASARCGAFAGRSASLA